MKEKQLVSIFKALADATRLQMIRFILSKGEVSCQSASLEFPLSQPTLSHHFNKLVDTEILNARKVGTAHFYSINKQLFKDLGLSLTAILKED